MKDVNPKNAQRCFTVINWRMLRIPFILIYYVGIIQITLKKHFSDKTKEILNGYSVLDDLEKRLPENFDSWEQLSKSEWLETTVFMSGYLLSSQGDRMGMANSVEGRYPFFRLQGNRILLLITSRL